MNLFLVLFFAVGAWARYPHDQFVLQSLVFSELGLEDSSACRLIKKDNAGDAYMDLYIDKIKSSSNDLSKVKIPLLVMRATDSDNFTTDFVFDAPSLKYSEVIDEKTKKFKVETKKDTPKIDESRLLNDYLIPNPKDGKDHEQVNIKFTVPESGMYCALIAVPPESKLSELKVTMKVKHSHGWLDYGSWVIYRQLSLGIALGAFLVGYLFYYILRFKVGRNFQNLNTVSLISKAVIFYVLVPFEGLLILRWLLLSVSNRIYLGDHGFLNFLDEVLIAADSCFNVYLHYCILLFAMGYGVIYSIGKTATSFSKMPYSSLKTATILLVSNIVAYLLNFIIILSSEYVYGTLSDNESLFGSSNGDLSFLLPQALLLVAGLFPIVWLIVSLSLYFRTQKVIANFSGQGDEATERERTSTQTSKGFKLSILVIFVMPVFIFTLTFILLVVGILKKSGLLLPSTSVVEDGELTSKALIHLFETTALNSMVYKFMVWSQLLEVYGSVALLYFIWIRNNNGLIIKANNVEEYEVDSE